MPFGALRIVQLQNPFEFRARLASGEVLADKRLSFVPPTLQDGAADSYLPR